MRRLGLALLLAIAAAAGAGGGYWYAERRAGMSTLSLNAEPAAAADQTILYYRDPTGAPFWSATPKKDAHGRDYLPVYGDDEPAVGSEAKKQQAAAAKRKIRVYRYPMGLPDTSPVPKKDSMGMDYIPVYEDDDQGDDNTIKVSVDRVQRSGVRTEKVQLRTLIRLVSAPGTVRIDERKQTVVTLCAGLHRGTARQRNRRDSESRGATLPSLQRAARAGPTRAGAGYQGISLARLPNHVIALSRPKHSATQRTSASEPSTFV